MGAYRPDRSSKSDSRKVPVLGCRIAGLLAIFTVHVLHDLPKPFPCIDADSGPADKRRCAKDRSHQAVFLVHAAAALKARGLSILVDEVVFIV